jgi:anaerobic magnesium-protoporphyrin IX monomethyl ester cyclase
MKVAVIAPPYPLEEAPAPPLGVTYVAAAFEAAGAEVRVLDYIVSRYSPEKLRRELEAFQPDLVGSTSVTMNFPAAAEIVETAKAIRPSAVTAMGGPHVTFDAENTLRTYPGIDLLVLGEGERTVQELLPLTHDKGAWSQIKGIAYLEDGRFVHTGERELIQDLETIPLPARHLLPVSRYQALGFPVSIITSRGCPYQCIFCQGRRMVGHRVRYRNPMSVVDEIEEVLAYGFTRINVADDLFLSNKARARAICKEILRRDLRFGWSAFVRVNIMDADVMRLMREAGCDSVSFGIETGSPEMLKRIRKRITLDQGRRAAEICREVGLTPHASFMVGLPGETPETLRQTQAYADSLEIIYGYHFLAPLPGTTVREEIDQYDLEILTNDWSLYDANRPVVQTSHVSAVEIQAFVDEFEVKNNARWEDMKERHRQGRTTPDEGLRVEGQVRLEFTYRLLSEDIIEEHCRFPLNDHPLDAEAEEALLMAKIREVTGTDGKLVAQVIGDFIAKGYLEGNTNGDCFEWNWTETKKPPPPRFLSQRLTAPQTSANSEPPFQSSRLSTPRVLTIGSSSYRPDARARL